MSDPQFTEPRYSDPRLSDPVVRRDESVGGVWGWIAGIAVLVLIGFILVAGWNSSSNTARNAPPPVTTGSAPMRNATPPSTTGSGTTRPMTPAPVTPAPANSGN